MDWHNNSKRLPKELHLKECKTDMPNFSGTNIAELKQSFYNGSFKYFGRMGFQVQIEKKQTPFTVTKLNTVHTGVFTY